MLAIVVAEWSGVTAALRLVQAPGAGQLFSPAGLSPSSLLQAGLLDPFCHSTGCLPPVRLSCSVSAGAGS